jgi:hypothetical protein
MKTLYYGLVITLFSTALWGHEFTPTYPKFKPSFIDDASVTTMKLWNKRSDVKYYEVTVFNSEWKPIPFATVYRLIKLDYNDQISFDIYVKNKDARKVTYICTTSKQLNEDVKSTGVMSRICSKVK